ncbi:hypothetical protein SAMN05421839_14020 [Halolactibacillus halophilus]|uniref:Uncharacterized protein n=1 Tax=Halolactibacillus halophilus TaxID=306540 RepID=A0A1I5S8U3_9BACI|nr:hypothetical protein [Halolactibacillus halophilus]GEM02695.1 hypothetical protein HHA03_22270 [Halolactibacillus halophilus]SFP67130.1 hypothetical protein SAMN05421839_14020 [Halolactibacillus halophilus]
MKKHITIILVLGLLLTACSNDNAEPVDDSDATEQDASTATESPEVDSSGNEDSDVSDETDDETNQADDPSNDNNEMTDDSNQADTTDDSETSTGTETSESGGQYSSDDAIRLVKDYLETEGLNTDMNYLYDGKDDNGHYRIQVFEVTDLGDGETHTATFNWFFVDPETGDITILFDLQ